MNPGRKSSKSNWDCTICVSCNCTGPCWTVPRKRENRTEMAGLSPPPGLPEKSRKPTSFSSRGGPPTCSAA